METQQERGAVAGEPGATVPPAQRMLPMWQAQLLALGVTVGVVVGFAVLFALLTGTL